MASKNLLDRLEQARRDLLDLSTRNRLLSTPRASTRSGRLEIVDERSEEIYRILVKEKKAMTFLSGRSSEGDEEVPAEETGLLYQPEADNVEDGLGEHHIDKHLQTRLTSEGLQRRLLKLYYDARTFEEEQGVSILYLALGFLKWYEADSSDRERYAPLLLIPVELDRSSAGARFRIEYTDDEIATNLSLQEKLKVDFGLRLPDVPDAEEPSPNEYFADVTKAVSTQPRWEVLSNDIVLWFFSFAKFLMYRNLIPDTWPKERQIEGHELIEALLGEGFRNEAPVCERNANIDGLLDPLDMVHVMDADSSQTIAIEEVKRGRNLVVQGPPGTGKSQTIANLIATAVKEGKSVLFVAEKMAALEVVKRRLDNVGLGDMCLELHSHKANKRAVVEELARTLRLGRPKVDNVAEQAEELKAYRDKLNRHAELMHTYFEPSHVTPFQALGELVRLRTAGVPPTDFELPDALTWTSAEFQEGQNMLADLARHVEEIGNPADHAWRGVQLDAVLPTDIDRLARALPSVIARLERLIAASSQLAETVQCSLPTTALEAAAVAQFARKLTKAPEMDRGSIGDTAWIDHRDDIDALVERGKSLASCRSELQGTVAEVAWVTDVAETRRHLASYGRSLFRIFNRKYREAQATLRGILVEAPPKSLNDRIQILDSLMAAQNALRKIEDEPQSQELGRRAFGRLWRGADSDWTALEAIAAWETDCRSVPLPDNFRSVMAGIGDLGLVAEQIHQLAQDLKPMLTEVKELLDQVKLDLAVAFDNRDVRSIPLAKLKSRLEAWRAGPESLTKWIAYSARLSKLRQAGALGLAVRLDEGRIPPAEAVDRFQKAYYESLMREAFRRCPELAEFDGMSHEQVLARFKMLDQERLSLARQEVALAHFEGLPSGGGTVGEVGIVKRELKKKRRHLPLRKLLQQAGHAVQAIKPVFMMSPVSIAQYLEPGVLEFDLLLIDEASQVRPVDALGAIARAKQVVVVGDDRQLPPTRFFSRIIGEEESEDGDEFQAADLESVLGLCEAQNIPQRMLQWHYRSRHHSLIAVSNREFYDDELYVIPSPFGEGNNLGLQFHYVSDGIFDRGGSATNRIEARAVADAVMEHARTSPDKTLGVGAFSVAQRDAILFELELRRRAAPELEPFFTPNSAEPFFIKNLENIQGDERDVIFISVGYAKDRSGYMAMNFGPLSNEGGERRLNVLITRSRERCVVFSSITADDIDLNRTSARGTQALKTFLTYAHKGHLDVATATGRGHDSPFEREVASAVRACGYQVDAQVGVAGFFVDLAVVDPDYPGRYLLGIECDGAMYHSSRSARDRDRLREQVLIDRGWMIHRIWSTDWFHRPEEQLRKTLAAIESAKAEWAKRGAATDAESDGAGRRQEPERIERQEENDQHESAALSLATQPYVEASFSINTAHEVHEVTAMSLAKIIERIVKIEGPIHREEIARRVASLWGYRRTGSRVVAAVDDAIAYANHEGRVAADGDFFSTPNETTVPIRCRDGVSSSTLRRPEFLPPAEIRTALLEVVRSHLGVAAAEAVVEASRLFGFKSTSGQLREIIESEVDSLVEAGMLELRNGKLYVPRASTADVP